MPSGCHLSQNTEPRFRILFALIITYTVFPLKQLIASADVDV